MKKSADMSFRISLRAARVNMRLTQRDLAVKIGVSELTVRNWENGRTQPIPLYINKLLELYNIRYEDIDWDNY